MRFGIEQRFLFYALRFFSTSLDISESLGQIQRRLPKQRHPRAMELARAAANKAGKDAKKRWRKPLHNVPVKKCVGRLVQSLIEMRHTTAEKKTRMLVHRKLSSLFRHAILISRIFLDFAIDSL